jgi:hypothetical protein
MNLNLRTIIIGLVSLGGLLAVYLLYSGISQTPEMDISKAGRSTESVDQPDADDFDSKLGKIGGVGVGAVKKFEYLHRDDNGEVDRKFGFRELLHQTKGQWETDKPYMEILLPVRCDVTADKGRVQVEDAAGGLSIKDAMFAGNVVMHIRPAEHSDIKESFIYLDDITFDSEKSRFSTPGPVRFVSEDSQMEGRGLEFIYNEALNRVEFFRIVDLDSFRMKSSQTALFAHAPPARTDPGKTPQLSQNADPNGSSRAGSPQQADLKQGEYYRCMFRENVVIDSPEHIVLAHDKISINNIFWSNAAGKKAAEARPSDANDAKPVAAPVATDSDPNKLRAESGEVVITCDGGIIIVPMSSELPPAGSEELASSPAEAEIKPPADFNHAADRPTTVARRIDYDVSTGDTILAGPVELDFYADMNDLVRGEAGRKILPVKVTAQKEAKFVAASNQVVLQGDCVATMLLADPNVQQKYTLSAETFAIDLLEDVSYQSRLRAGDIKCLTANGGVVRLKIFKTAGQELLGGVDLQCRRIDYDAAQQVFVAAGPGILVVDNSQVSEPSPKPGGFSLRKRCYAFLRFFDTLKYYMKANRVVADAKPPDTLKIDYFPVVKDQYGQHAVATAAHVEFELVESADRRNELSTLTASGAVTYEDEDNQFSGGDLFYDREKSQLLVKGDEFAPCYFNGAIVQSILYDLKTGKVEAPLAGPGALQIKR